MVRSSSPHWDTCIRVKSEMHLRSAASRAGGLATVSPKCVKTHETATFCELPNVIMERLPSVPSPPAATCPALDETELPPLPVTPRPAERLTSKEKEQQQQQQQHLRLPLAMLQLLLPELSNHMPKETERELHSEVDRLALKLKRLERRLSVSSDLSSGGCSTVLAPDKNGCSPRSTEVSIDRWRSSQDKTTSRQTRRSSVTVARAALHDPRYSGKQVLIEMFRDLDLDHSGTVDRAELVEGLERLGIQEENARKVVSGLSNDSGHIDFGAWRDFVEDSQNAKLLVDLKNKYQELRMNSDSSIAKRTTSKSRSGARWMLRPDSRARCFWDAILMALCCYLVVSLPFLVAFDAYIGDATMTGLDSLHLCIDLLFLFDVIINFRTGMTIGLQLVMQPRLVAVYYVKGWFFIDLLSSIPFEEVTQGAVPTFRPLKLLKLAKLARILRFLKPLQEIQETLLDEFSGASRLRSMLAHCNVVLLTALICHWLACGMAIADRGWLQNYQDVNDSLSRVYLTALYWSMTTMTTVGYGDIVPTADSERTFSIFAMVIGGAFYGYLIGTITEVVSSSDLNNLKYKERMSLVLSFVDHYKLPPRMRRRVLKYFRGITAEKSAQSLSELTAELSPNLLKEMSCYLISHDILYHPLFTNVPFNALIRVEALAKTLLVDAGSVVASEGDAGTAMFVVTAGTCKMELEDSNGTLIQETLVPGNSFGEEIITGLCETYMYQVTAATNCRLFMVEEGNYVEAFEYMPTMMETMQENAATRSIYAKHFPQSVEEAMMEPDSPKARPRRPSKF
eukprot:TRINITY_DN7250_c0_g1_i1.p1 TRINITY_DN7250_c0_g1~~TRINITY_DN7250_c0_g1_i1.p1  ORF type:complete len:794 (+),score=142.87 TRINITY_DN7250_c0_g1_i1:95-2476(+)